MRHRGRLHTASWDRLASGSCPLEQLVGLRRDVRMLLNGEIARTAFLAMLTQTGAAAPLAFQAVDDADRTQFMAIPTIPGRPGLLSLVALDWLDPTIRVAANAVARCQNGSCMAHFSDRRDHVNGVSWTPVAIVKKMSDIMPDGSVWCRRTGAGP